MRIFLPQTLVIVITIFTLPVFGNVISQNGLPPANLIAAEGENLPEKDAIVDSNIIEASVELTGIRRNGKIEFLWTHNAEGGTFSYILQRSDDNKKFENISTHQLQSINIGDIFYDVDSTYRPLEDKRFYRLKVTDNQGNIFYSQIIKS